jgi:hypothetical protein
MAYNINSAPIVIDSDDEFYDSDEERDHVMGPVTEPVPLQDAISSASKAILVKTLLEICEHNKGSKELATSLLAPPHAPSGPRGTKRKASPTGTTPTGAMVTKEIDRICENCRRKFGDTVQITKDCRYHPGKLYFRCGTRDWCRLLIDCEQARSRLIRGTRFSR